MYSQFLILSLTCTVVISEDSVTVKSSPKWTSLRVTLSSDPLWAFQPIPLDFWEADIKGWRATSESCTNGGAFNGFRFIPKDEDSIAGLYDINGILSGFQMMLKRSKIMIPENHYQFASQPMFQNDSVLGADVLVLTAYFVDPSRMCETQKTNEVLKTNGIGTGLWFQNGPSPFNFITVPEMKPEDDEKGWRNNMCLPMMGHHSFYESEKWEDSNCAEFLPAWVFYDMTDRISGFGFIVSGFDDSPRYQHLQGILLQHILGTYSSECAANVADSIGVTMINIYFDESPENIVCEIPYEEEEQVER